MEKPNLNYIKNMSQGDKEFENKLLDIIKKELPEEITTYEKNLFSKKYELAAGNVHKIKHKISILGLMESYKIAEEFENDLLEGSLKLQDDFDQILKTMSDFINKL